MSSIRINLTRTGCCVLFSALALFCSLPSYAGTEEVSLYSMSNNWGAAYDNSTRTLTFSDVANWNKGRGWNFDWKYIDGNIESYIIEFGSATTAAIAIVVKYSYNYTDHTKTFDFDAGVTSATLDMHTDFGSDTYSLDYILIKAGADCTITLNRAYFTTTGNSDVYQAENADFAGYTENFTSADNSVVKVEGLTDDDHVTFTVNAPCKAVYRLNIGYNNGTSDNDRACNLSVNNGSDIGITLPKTGAEGNKDIGEVAYSTILNKGANTITIHGNWRWYNIDYLRVYHPQLYLIGNIHESGYNWAPNAGKWMDFDSENEVFTCTTRIGTGTYQDGSGNFAFATVLAENNDDGGWTYMNAHRWSPSEDNLAVEPDGKTATTNIIKQGWNSYQVPMAGTYTVTMKADLSSFTVQGPAVYMFGLHEGTGYSWETNSYSMMTYDAANEVYRLRTRIADGAESSNAGEVAFATGYSDSNDWNYLNANRYGPSTSGNPTLNGTTNTIGKNGDVKFTGITAGKYEVVVDMLSATKTARFYPLYTFGYEVVGTNAHGAISCTTDDTEIPLGGTPTVTATPDDGYRFVKWTNESDTQLSTSASYTPTITANTWLKAWFEPDPSCLLSIAATDYAFAKLGDNVYTANGYPFFDDGSTVSFDWSANESGAEVFYPVHLDAGTYYFYCTLDNNGVNRKMRLYEPSISSGDLYYSGQRWNIADSHDFGGGSGTFETKDFTVTAGDYLIALFAERNTGFSHINVVGVCDGATANTCALTLSAGSNGSVISDQINNAKIISGTSVLLLAEPASGYRFQQWNDGNTANPRTVTLSSNSSLAASFNQTNGCMNTVTLQCESDSVSPNSRPIASPAASNTVVSDGILTNKEGEKSIYYAFTLTEPATCSVTLITPRGDKRQKIYLYSAQLSEGTSLTYGGGTYYQVQDPTAADSPNSGANHVYPVCSTTLELAAGKYIIGLYSEYSWSQYDRIVITAGGDDIDCSQADITIAAGDEVELPHSVRNLTVYQGGSATNSHDVRVLNSVTYIRHAYGGANSNEMNKWYPFCVPFSVSACKVYDEADEADYSIGAIYLKDGDGAGNPTGAGYFYLKYLTNDYTGVQPDEFRNRWAYIDQALPEAYVPYIILFVNHWEDTDTDDDYFELNPVVKFIGGAQTIEGTAKIDRIPADNGAEAYYYYANNTLSPIHLDDAYVYDKENSHFDYHEDVTIAPFECYIQATESFKARHRSIAMPRVGQNEDTATAVAYTSDGTCPLYIFDITGRLIAHSPNGLPRGVYICKRGNETRKLIIR